MPPSPPPAEAEAEPMEPKSMSIRFSDTNDNELVFKLKPTTKLKKAMDAYAQRQSLVRNPPRFLFDGDKIQDDHTPESFGMEDGDNVEVYIEQIGGGDAEERDGK